MKIDQSLVIEFQSGLRGKLILPDDVEYENARKVYNGMISKKPAMIVICADVADIIHCVNFARKNDILLSVRSGGHNAGGLGICDGGLVIDLSHIKYTKVDPEAKTVIVGAGCTWGDVDHATQIFGLACPSGIISTTGVGGLTLGGGIGHLTRHYGLTIDNLLSIDLVKADGSFITADEKQNQDLFWAVRGGGGNFGVVTAFKFKLSPVNVVFGGPILWDLSEAEEVLKWYREFILKAPNELNGFFNFITVPPVAPFPESLHMKKMCGIVWNYTGPLGKAEEIFKPVRNFKKPALDLTGPMPYTALQTMFDDLYPTGYQWYWRADFIKEIPDEAIEIHKKFAAKLPTLHSTMHLYPVNGAASHVGKKDTAWTFRDANWSMVIVGVDPDPANKEKITKWTKEYWDALHPYSAGAAYVNFMMDEGDARVKATYGDNYNKLVEVKNKYDPENLFRVNQNITPSVHRVKV
ncbi:FAD-binding oxidoreductase [Sporocytophaga myxococcoides]|uniref:FAD-binding oxidoreductase n=1 Tax=Sporocytophaga myxococcoides TaxID=153721 RepID=UPI0005EE9F5A|nr:FAD-binding oxidoreductase [Sporocytophaga myxococcoides]